MDSKAEKKSTTSAAQLIRRAGVSHSRGKRLTSRTQYLQLFFSARLNIGSVDEAVGPCFGERLFSQDMERFYDVAFYSGSGVSSHALWTAFPMPGSRAPFAFVK